MDTKTLSKRLADGKPVYLDSKPYAVIEMNDLLKTVDLQDQAGNTKPNVKFTEVKSHG